MPISIAEIEKKLPSVTMWKGNPEYERIAKDLYNQMFPIRELKDVSEGDRVSAVDVLAYRVLGQSSYIGCNVCYSKKDGVEEGISFTCTNPKCAGQQRIATKHKKSTLLGADTTSKVILDFPAFAYKIENPDQYVGKVLRVTGRVQTPRKRKVKDGKEETTPVIMVQDMTVVSDVRDNGSSYSESSTPKPPSPAEREPTTPIAPPSPPLTQGATNIPAPKMKAFQTWMLVQNKAVTEAQVKSYVEGNLKLSMADILPLLEPIHKDSEGVVYRLKESTN